MCRGPDLNRRPHALPYHITMMLDYLITHIGCWALIQDYCWDSPVSLYTFQKTINPSWLGSGLPYLGFPRIHPICFKCYHLKARRFRHMLYQLSYLGILPMLSFDVTYQNSYLGITMVTVPF